MALVSKQLASKLSFAGFKRQSPHLWRESEGLVNVINLQASQWGTSKEGQFTVNLAITSRQLYSIWTGKPFPSNPGTAIWPIQVRIGHLLDGRDVWWPVDRSTDQDVLAATVTARIAPASLAWFSAYPNPEDLDAALEKVEKYGDVPGVYEAQAPLIRAILSTMRGNIVAAHKLMASSFAAHRGKPFEATVAAIAERLSINVA